MFPSAAPKTLSQTLPHGSLPLCASAARFICRCVMLLASVGIAAFAVEVTPAMKADFEQRARAALQRPDPEAWFALSYEEGMSPETLRESRELEKTINWEPLHAAV